MAADPDTSSAMNDSTGSGEASVSSSGNQAAPQKETAKKKRNLPGMPDPDAKVIALSPTTLMATNRFGENRGLTTELLQDLQIQETFSEPTIKSRIPL